MSNIHTLTTVTESQVKLVLTKLRDKGFFMNAEDRNTYNSVMTDDERHELLNMINCMKNLDDGLKSHLFDDIFKEFGIKSVALIKAENTLLEMEKEIELKDEYIKVIENKLLAAEKTEEARVQLLEEIKERNNQYINDMDAYRLSICKNTDTKLRSKMLQKAFVKHLK